MKPKITYCTWDGDAALLLHYPDGRILGFAHMKDGWRGGLGADVSHKAKVMTKADYDRRYRALGLPAFPE